MTKCIRVELFFFFFCVEVKVLRVLPSGHKAFLIFKEYSIYQESEREIFVQDSLRDNNTCRDPEIPVILAVILQLPGVQAVAQAAHSSY